MRIRRIEVRNFSKLGHIVVEGLEDGLNVLVGDNEAGKSTLLEALRAGLFDAASDRRRRMPKGCSPMGSRCARRSPSISSSATRRWSLRKAFCQKPEAELIGPGERLTGDAVEERLAALLGFVPPGRGEPKPDEHHGIHGLLWVAAGHGAWRRSRSAPIETRSLRRSKARSAKSWAASAGGPARSRRGATRRALDKRGKPRGEFARLAEDVTVLAQKQRGRRRPPRRLSGEGRGARGQDRDARTPRFARIGSARRKAGARAGRGAVQATEALSTPSPRRRWSLAPRAGGPAARPRARRPAATDDPRSRGGEGGGPAATEADAQERGSCRPATRRQRRCRRGGPAADARGPHRRRGPPARLGAGGGSALRPGPPRRTRATRSTRRKGRRSAPTRPSPHPSSISPCHRRP